MTTSVSLGVCTCYVPFSHQNIQLCNLVVLFWVFLLIMIFGFRIICLFISYIEYSFYFWMCVILAQSFVCFRRPIGHQVWTTTCFCKALCSMRTKSRASRSAIGTFLSQTRRIRRSGSLSHPDPVSALSIWVDIESTFKTAGGGGTHRKVKPHAYFFACTFTFSHCTNCRHPCSGVIAGGTGSLHSAASRIPFVAPLPLTNKRDNDQPTKDSYN